LVERQLVLTNNLELTRFNDMYWQ